jgi:hypothetical protein
MFFNFRLSNICSVILNKSIEFIWITQVRFRGVRVAQSLVFYVIFVNDSLYLCSVVSLPLYYLLCFNTRLLNTQGRIQGGGGAPGACPPPHKIGKKIKKISDYSHEIPQKCSCLPPLGAIFLSAPPPLIPLFVSSNFISKK